MAATTQAIELAKHGDQHRCMHAFPNIDNAPSNAICRKLGFELVEACQFEFPKGHFTTCMTMSRRPHNRINAAAEDL